MSLKDKLIEDVYQAEIGKSADGPIERPNPGKDELVRAGDNVWICGPHAVGADPAEHVVDGAEIAHAVIDDGDHDCPCRHTYRAGSLTLGSAERHDTRRWK
jgi:hypothetical protein